MDQIIKGVYAYNGFEQPKLLAENFTSFLMDNEFTIVANYKGDVTEDLIEELKDMEHAEYSKDDIRTTLWYYGIFYDSPLEEYQQFNTMKGLERNQYLNDFINTASKS